MKWVMVFYVFLLNVFIVPGGDYDDDVYSICLASSYDLYCVEYIPLGI